MGNILKNPQHRARLGYNGHDMSRRVLFTSSTGHLIPVLFDYLEPGTKIRMNDALFTRTQPLKQCAFVRLTEHIDYFFVPMDQIDGYFNQAFYGIQDAHNTNDVTKGNSSQQYLPIQPTTAPLLSITGKDGIFGSWNSSNVIKWAWINSANDVLTMNGRFNLVACDADGNIVKTAGSPATATLPDNFDHYEVWLLSKFNNSFNGVSFDSTETVINSNYGGSYGFTAFGTPWIYDFFRLASMLGHGERLMVPDSSQSYSATFVPRLWAAYQKIWYDYYRCDEFTPNNPFAYNLNQAFKVGNYDSYYPVTSTYGNSDMFTLRHRPFKKDYFTNTKVSPLFSPGNYTYGYGSGQLSIVSSLGHTSELLNAYSAQLQQYGVNSVFPGVRLNTTSSSYPAYEGVVSENVDVLNSTTPQVGGSSSVSAVNTVQQIRAMFAFDKMLQITQRAGKTYEDQTAAHYGYTVPQGIRGHVYYLGGHSTPLQIGEVVATAAGSAGSSVYDQSVLGQIAGRGLGASRKNRTIKFTAPCHGIMMALYSCLPEIDYHNYGFDRRVYASGPNDFPHIEFDKLGMQPLYAQESFGSLGGFSTSYNYGTMLGWQYRYQQYKTSYDVVCGAFNYTLQDWTSAIIFGAFGNSSHFDSVFYCPPTYLDSIMSLNYNPVPEQLDGLDVTLTGGYIYRISTDVKPNIQSAFASDHNFSKFSFGQVFERDPLLHSIDFKYYKVDKYSTYGLPSLNSL